MQAEVGREGLAALGLRRGRIGEYAGNARDGHFAGEGAVAEDLRGGVEIAEWVGCDDHDSLLGISAVPLSLGSR